MRLKTSTGVALAAALITGFAGAANAASIPVVNAGFETPAGADGVLDNLVDGTNGWTKTGGGQVYNPGLDVNAPEGSNSYLILEGVGGYDLGSGSILQELGDVLSEGAYTLTVQVGENATASSSFGTGYQVQLGVIDGAGSFSPLATDDSTLLPSDGFETSTVMYTTKAGDPIGANLAIQLAGQVTAGSNNQVLFDDVRLDFAPAPGDRDVYLKVQPFDKVLPSGGTVEMWGFASCDATFTECAAPSETDAPGPRIDAFAGYELRVHVLNTLAIPVSFNIPGQTGEVDRAPVMMTDNNGKARVQSLTHETPTGSNALDAVTYRWTDLRAGTFLYQSGTLPSIQVPMGLYGALVVNEGAGGTAYGEAFDTEALLVLSEVDPVQNARVAAAATALPDETCVSLPEYEQNMTPGYPCTVDYSPRYFFVNGGATADLPVGDPATPTTALLRLVNAGLRSHTPSIVGVELGLIAEDGNPYSIQRNQSAALLAAGKSLDALVDLPSANITFSLFDRMPPFSNDNMPAGGSLATLQVGSGTPPVIEAPHPAQDDSYDVTEDTALVVSAGNGVLFNDDGLTGAVAVSGPAHGSLSLAADGGFTYVPNPDYSGKDSFTYTAEDAGMNTYGARVTLNVSFDNDAPVAVADSYSNNLGSVVDVKAPGVLANDADADGDQLYALLDSGSAVLNADGSFTAGSGTSFTYVACDQPLDTSGTEPVCPGAASDPVAVEVTVYAASGISLTVVEPSTDPLVGPTPVTAYRWTLELDRTFHPDPANPQGESLATTFHSSYMPVVAQGCVGAGACSDDETETPFTEAVLDPSLHYYVSVLPADAMWDDASGFRVGHTIGGTAIAPGDTSVTVNVHPQPLEYAQISMIVFEDNNPTNGAIDGPEVGLGGVQITLEDAGGRYGMSAGMLSQDADGNPLTNALDCFNGAPPAPGIIMSCPRYLPEPDADGNPVLSPLAGQILIKNLFPGKYGIIATAPSANADGSPVTWSQTSTIEGTKVIDAWVKSGEPPFFAEFGPAGWHAFIGFVNPADINAGRTGAHTISGAVTNNHMSRPPEQKLWDSETYDALAHTRPWVGLNTLAGTGPNIAAVQATVDDATGVASFEIPNVPDGDYQLVIWDAYLDQVIAYRSVTVAGGSIDVGNIPVFNWFARLENHVFLDENENGIRDAGEGPLAEQAVNVRWRDGTMYQSFPTDLEGFVPFDQVFPFFNWLVAEVDFARFKATGVTVTVDAGGDVSATGNVLNPQEQTECVGDAATCESRTETGPVLTQGFQAFLGQTNVMEWGKKPYAPGENGGISGIVYYGVTRAENDPRLAAAEPWEPGVPGVTVRLYRQVQKAGVNLPIVNPSFEYPMLGGAPLATLDGSDPAVGWTKTGGGQIYNPGVDANAPDGFNSYLILSSIGGYDLGSGSIEQKLNDVLTEGTYTLSVQVGENVTSSSSFGAYKVQLGVFDGSGFVLLAEDDNSLAPVDGFLTSTVEYTAAVDDVNLGLELMIRLVGDVAGTGNVQVLFDDVQLSWSDDGLALVAETTTDSWDESLPSGCPGAAPIDKNIVGLGPDDASDAAITTKCYDGLRNFNQVRPGVFDGGYAFMDIPPGKYVVEAIPPAGYEILKEEDVNVSFGDAYATPPLPTPGPAAIPDLPTYEMVAAALAPEPGLAQPPCVGELRQVPDKMSLFPAANAEAPFRQAWRPLCDRKAVILSDQGQAAADFTIITDAPISGHYAGMVLDDVAQEFNPLSPQFGEKWAPPFVPVSVRDFKGLEISRVYSDQWGRMNGLLPSTYTANMPSPSGFSPAMHMTCMNDPGPIPGPDGKPIVDPQYNPAYSNFCYTFQYMPGATTYLDTPVVPVSAFASGYNPPDCALSTATPMIANVDGDGLGFGPLATQGGTLTITSLGTGVRVPNPAYEGPLEDPATPAGQKTITRDYDFGTVEGTVTINGVELTVTSWDATTIVATVENPTDPTIPIGTGQLVVTRGDNGNATEYAVTVTVSDETPIVVSAGGSIQAAIDNAEPGSLILVEPGAYNESVIMWKPVRLQGAGAGSTIINAVKRPTEAIAQWRTRMDSYFGIGGGTRVVDPLPNQPDGAAGFDVSEGAGITVLGPYDSGSGRRPFNSFLRGSAQARVDGFSVTGGDVGGGILVNSNAHRLAISNNHVFGNNGSWHGGIRVGEPFLQLGAPEDGAYGFNVGVNIHHNAVDQNGGLDGAGGGISIASGSDGYHVTSNQVCGNFTLGDGGGIGHLGLSNMGVIADNTIRYNQSFNQGTPVSGGGVFVGGEPPPAGELTMGSGSVNIGGNLIQGNQAGAGSGGGIRAQFVNGQDIVAAVGGPPNNPNPGFGSWYQVVLENNTVVNNMAARAGGGISFQDTARSVLAGNTIAHNDSTATVGGLINNNLSTNEPAGIDTEPHSAALAAVMMVDPSTDGLREFSNPMMDGSNTLWENRSFYYDATGGSAILVPDLVQSQVGECPDGATFWDLDPLLGGSLETTSAAQPAEFASPYCNGGRSLATTPGPIFALPALDEGGNAWVEVRFGPLTPAWPEGTAPWSY